MPGMNTNSLFLADCYCCWLGPPGSSRRSARCRGVAGGWVIDEVIWCRWITFWNQNVPVSTGACLCWHSGCVPPVSYHHSHLQLSTRPLPLLSVAACFTRVHTVTNSPPLSGSALHAVIHKTRPKCILNMGASGAALLVLSWKQLLREACLRVSCCLTFCTWGRCGQSPQSCGTHIRGISWTLFVPFFAFTPLQQWETCNQQHTQYTRATQQDVCLHFSLRPNWTPKYIHHIYIQLMLVFTKTYNENK